MEKAQLIAITQMAEARHEFNLGVLSSIGREELATSHATLCRLALSLCALRDAADDNTDTTVESMLAPLNKKAQALQNEIEVVVKHRNQAWALIQKLIDQAKLDLEQMLMRGHG